MIQAKCFCYGHHISRSKGTEKQPQKYSIFPTPHLPLPPPILPPGIPAFSMNFFFEMKKKKQKENMERQNKKAHKILKIRAEIPQAN